MQKLNRRSLEYIFILSLSTNDFCSLTLMWTKKKKKNTFGLAKDPEVFETFSL